MFWNCFLHWLLYLGVLGGFAAFAVNYTGWFSFYAFVLVLCLPLFSLLLTLPALPGTRFTLSAPETVQRGADAFLEASAEKRYAFFVFCPMAITLCLVQYSLSSADARKRQVRCHCIPVPIQKKSIDRAAPCIRIPMDTIHAARIRSEVQSAKMTDFLGLFVFSLIGKKTVCRDTLVLPRAVPPKHMPAFREKPDGGLVPTSHFSEQTEIRMYRPGDAMRSVHWKLSAKTGDLLVRESVEHKNDTVAVTFDRTPDAEQADRIYDCLDFVLRSLCSEDGRRTIVVLWKTSAMENAQAEISSPEQLSGLYRQIFSCAPPAQPYTVPMPFREPAWLRADCGYHISADLQIDSKKREVQKPFYGEEAII